ncbi:Crp/Fnr family transcriptional regulator [Lacihabitans lacunae]|uniref:Crp/Fnr family transcriptional regulator n=1 Tax=Lacihabitans lacunae TaxID=1028214 RepID=A0ABV7YT78_9BACT
MKPESEIVTKIFESENLTPFEVNLVCDSFEKISVKKGDILLQAHDQVNFEYYVQTGCLRTYFIDPSGKEHTLQFAINDWWISDYTAYFTEGKAMMFIECIQDATLYKVSHTQMEQLYAQIPKVETFFRRKMERAFASFQKRILATLSQTATQRYISFIETYPNIEQIVKNYHIASFLGITTESLSRIRKEISQ